MYQPLNQVRLRGFLTESARHFVSRSGQPRIAFRMEVWIDDENLPPKKPAGGRLFLSRCFRYGLSATGYAIGRGP